MSKNNTRQTGSLPSVFFDTRQRNKIFFLGKKEKKKNEKKNFAECPDLGHSAKEKNLFLRKKEKKNEKNFAECPYLEHSAKEKNLFFWERRFLPSAQI